MWASSTSAQPRGVTVFLNSHLLSEVEITCDRVAFIKHGEVLETRELRGLAEGVLQVAIRARKLTTESIQGLSPWASSARLEGERLTLEVSSSDVLPEILRYLVERGADVYEVIPRRTSLEELFLRIIGTDGGL